jgi:acylphosphatase
MNKQNWEECNLKLMDRINEYRKLYVVLQVKNIKMPEFQQTTLLRKKIVFSGKVQKVGFRLEVYELAKRLELSGWVKNRLDNSVEAELQGEIDKIDFLLKFMQSLKRATVKNLEIVDIDVDHSDLVFTLIKEVE